MVLNLLDSFFIQRIKNSTFYVSTFSSSSPLSAQFAELRKTIGRRRRINTEESAKVVTAIWGTEFIQCLAALAIVHLNNLNNGMNCIMMI